MVYSLISTGGLCDDTVMCDGTTNRPSIKGLLSGHLRENGRQLVNRGRPLKRGLLGISTRFRRNLNLFKKKHALRQHLTWNHAKTVTNVCLNVISFAVHLLFFRCNFVCCLTKFEGRGRFVTDSGFEINCNLFLHCRLHA